MTDPVAEAAAKIAAQQAEPSLLEKAMDTVHDLEAKVEHLIHPETEAPTVEAPKEALPSGTPADSGTSPGSSGPASTESEAGNVAGAAVAGAPEAGAAPAAGGELPNVQGATGSPIAPSAPSGIDTTSTLTSQGSGSSMPDTLTSQVSSTGLAGSIEVPNAVLAAAVQPDTPPSAEPVSTPAGIPGIVVSSAEPLKTVGATPSMIAACHIDKIRESIANIKHHLSIRGFEQSAVQDIHAELEAIEKWL